MRGGTESERELKGLANKRSGGEKGNSAQLHWILKTIRRQPGAFGREGVQSLQQ